MRKILAALAIVTLSSAPAVAELACGALIMPAAQLKQVSRGITAHHSGLDLIAPHGSPVRVATAGTVAFVGTYYGYGRMVDVDHGGGVVTRYAHLSGFAAGIQPGVRVAVGGLLGQVGRTGRATTNHLHFEVRLGRRAVDPKPYLALADCTARAPAVRTEEARAPAASRGARLTDRLVMETGRTTDHPEGRPGGLLD